MIVIGLVYLFVETNDSYLDEYGVCICDKDENMLGSANSVSTRSLARTERKRQRAFLKRHTTLGIDSNMKRRKRKHRKRQLNFATDEPQKLTSRLISEINSNRRIKRNIPSVSSNLTNIDENFKVIDIKDYSILNAQYKFFG